MDEDNSVYSYDCQEMSLVKEKASRGVTAVREVDKNLPRQVQGNSNHTIIRAHTSELKTKKTYFITIFAATFLFLLALALIAVVVYTPLASSLNKEGSELMTEVQTLKLQMNHSHVELNAKIENLRKTQEGNGTRLHNLADEIHAFQQSVNEKLNSLQLVVNSVNHVQHITSEGLSNVQTAMDTLTSSLNMTASQLSHLHSSLAGHSTVTTQIASLQTVMNGLNTVQHNITSHVINLQYSVDSLTRRVQAPVTPFQNCTKETASCTMYSSSYSRYYINCLTPYLAINVTVSCCNINYIYNHV